MKKCLLFVFLVMLFPVTGIASNTTITASNIDYFGGAPITGQFCLSPTDAYGNPINLTTSTGQQFPANPPLCFTVTAGVLASGATVPDVSTTQPVNACYKVQVLNATGSVVGKYPCIQPTGTTWSFDSYVPGNPPNIPYYVGPSGPAGPAGPQGPAGPSGGAILTPGGIQYGASSTSGTNATSAQIAAALNVTPSTQLSTALIPALPYLSTSGGTLTGTLNAPSFNTILYPAPGTGTISAALSANPSGNVHIVLGCGTYIDNLSWTSSYNWIQGSGQCTVLEPRVSTAPLINIHPASAGAPLYYNQVTDLQMENPNAYTVDGIQLNNIASGSPHNDYNTFARLTIQNFENGVDILGGTLWNTFEDIHISSSVQNGFSVNTTQPVNDLSVTRLASSSNGGYGVYANVGSVVSWLFARPDVEGNGASILNSNCAGIYVNGTANGVENLAISHGYFEGNCLAGDANAANIRLTGTGIFSARITDNYFSYGNGANGCGILDDATEGSGEFSQNQYKMQASTCGYDVKVVNTDTSSGQSHFTVGPDTYFNNGQPYDSVSAGGPISVATVINSGVTGLPIGSLYYPNGISSSEVTSPTVNATTGYKCNGSYGTSGQLLSTTGTGCNWMTLNLPYLPLAGGTLTGDLTIAPATGDATIAMAPTGATAFTMGVANQTNPAWYLLDGYRGTVDFAVLNGNAIGGSAYAGALIGNTYSIIGFAVTNNAQQATYSDASFNRYAAGTLGVCSTSTYACDTGSLIAANLTATNALVAGNMHTTSYTVSTLPAASSLTAGTMVEVSDAASFTPGTCTGGGSDYMIAITNGTAWSCH